MQTNNFNELTTLFCVLGPHFAAIAKNAKVSNVIHDKIRNIRMFLFVVALRLAAHTKAFLLFLSHRQAFVHDAFRNVGVCSVILIFDCQTVRICMKCAENLHSIAR